MFRKVLDTYQGLATIIVSVFRASCFSPRSAGTSTLPLLWERPPVAWTIYRLASPSPQRLLDIYRAGHRQKHLQKSCVCSARASSAQLHRPRFGNTHSWFSCPPFFSRSWLVTPKLLPLLLFSLPSLPAMSHSCSLTISESDHWRTFRAKSTENTCVM